MSDTPATTGRRGRPSVRDKRRAQIITGFVELVIARGHHDVTIAEVAERADVHRSSVRHFIGNRSQLIIAALDHIEDIFQQHYVSVVGDEPSVQQILDFTFGTVAIDGHPDLAGALLILSNTAVSDADVREHLRITYEAQIRQVAYMLAGDDGERARAVAYAIVCLAEHNWTMQHVGVDATYNAHARAVAQRLIDEFLAESQP
ncbi:MAG: hypothetical protein AAGA65_15330 [Actinomycetota bacterium]